jgi:hypothetical protein
VLTAPSRVIFEPIRTDEPLIGLDDPIFNAEEQSRPDAENRTVVAL